MRAKVCRFTPRMDAPQTAGDSFGGMSREQLECEARDLLQTLDLALDLMSDAQVRCLQAMREQRRAHTSGELVPFAG